MIFRQPNDLARAINHWLDQLTAGETLVLTFTQRDVDRGVLQHALEVAHEVAQVRGIAVALDGRTISLW